MVSLGALLLALAAGGTVASVAAAGGITLWLPRVRARQRVQALSGRAPLDAIHQASQTLLRDHRSSQFAFVDQWLQGRKNGSRTRLRLEQAGIPLRAGEFMLLRALALPLFSLLGFTIANAAHDPLILAVGVTIGALAGLFGPVVYVKQRVKARRARVESQLVEMTELMAASMEAGVGYLQSLVSTMEQLEPPLSVELRRLTDEVRLGGDIDDAVDALKRRIDSKDFDVLATAIGIQRQNGGNLAGILKGVALTVRDRQSFRREVAALTSRERFSALIIAALPFLLVAALTAMLPQTYGLLFSTSAGRIALVSACVMDAIGYFAIKKVSRIDV